MSQQQHYRLSVESRVIQLYSYVFVSCAAARQCMFICYCAVCISYLIGQRCVELSFLYDVLSNAFLNSGVLYGVWFVRVYCAFGYC